MFFFLFFIGGFVDVSNMVFWFIKLMWICDEVLTFFARFVVVIVCGNLIFLCVLFIMYVYNIFDFFVCCLNVCVYVLIWLWN